MSDFVFGPESDRMRSIHTLIKDIRKEGRTYSALEAATERVKGNIVVHEWSCAVPAEALRDSVDASAARARFCTAQLDMYMGITSGHSFWSR